MCYKSKDIRNEVIIRIWSPVEHNNNNNGHISIEIPKNGIYASFWPLPIKNFACQSCEIFNAFMGHSNKVDTNNLEKYEYDKNFAGYRCYNKWVPIEPKHTLKFYCLDIDRITKEYLKFQRKMEDKYEICYDKNHNAYNCGFRYIECSMSVYNLLRVGHLDNLLNCGVEYGQQILDMHKILSTPKTVSYFFNAIYCLEQKYFGQDVDDKAIRIWYAKLIVIQDKLPTNIMNEIKDFKMMNYISSRL